MDPDLTVLSRIRIGSRSDLVITFKLIVGICQNIRKNVQSVVAYWRIRIGSGSQILKGLGSGSDPDLFLLGLDRFRIF